MIYSLQRLHKNKIQLVLCVNEIGKSIFKDKYYRNKVVLEGGGAAH